MAKYREVFKKYDLKVARYCSLPRTLTVLVRAHLQCIEPATKNCVIPIINENDVTSIDELMRTEGCKANFSDNDILSVLAAGAVCADLVIILSDVDGLYTADPSKPGAELIKIVESITTELKDSLSGKSKLGRGGIQSKIKAAEIATSCGIPVVIANSRKENVIIDILSGKEVGTYFKPQNRMPAVKR